MNTLTLTPSSMLDRQRHARLIADFENVCAVAGLQGRFLQESMKTYCSPEEVEWVSNFRTNMREGSTGLVLEGISRPDTRCQAICAAFVRNYIDARVVPLNTVLEAYEEDKLGNPTVLLIPNLYVHSAQKNMLDWKVQTLYDLLLQRSVNNRATVLYVENMSGLQKAYGLPFADFLSGFLKIT